MLGWVMMMGRLPGSVDYVMFYDGECAFCSARVVWVMRRDHRECMAAAPLQGELAEEIGLAVDVREAAASLVMWRRSDGCLFMRSDAVVELLRTLGGRWRLLGGLLGMVPRWLRDAGYDWIARNRHQLRGGVACVMPDESWRKRTLR